MTDKFTAIIKEAQDIIESSVFPKVTVEQGNKKFLEADKKNNETQRLYRKSLEKLNNQVKELRKSGDNEDNVDPKVYYCNRKSGRGAYQAALKTAQDLQDKAIDTRRALDAEQDRQEGLKKEGLKGVITRDIVVKPSKKHDGYAYGKVLNKNESLEILKEAQDIMSNLFEVEYYGANDVEEEQNNKIKRQGKDKHGNKVDLVSVQDELFPYEGNAKEQYNKKIIAKINDMIEGKATLEDLIQLVRNKKTPVSESEFTVHKGNPVVKITDKNYKVAHGKGLPGPFNEKQIGQYIVYNKDTDASYLVTPDNWKKSKIKRDLEREGKVFEGAIELIETLIKEEEKKECKNNKQHVFKRMDDPEKGKIGVKKNYNRVIHNDSASKDPFHDYVKIKGTKYSVDKYGQIGASVKEGFEGAVELLEAIISETSDERAHAASVESHNRFNRAKATHDSLEKMIKSNKKTNFFSPEEIEELKGDLEQKKKELKKASRISVRDNRNQFNRDKRLGRV